MRLTIWLLVLNVFFGNALLYLTISSNWFIASLLLHFPSIFHVVFTISVCISMIAFVQIMAVVKSRINRIGLALLSAIVPVLFSCWLVIGYAFSKSAKEIATGLLISMKFGSLMALIAGAVYWVPFWLVNFMLAKRMANDGLHQIEGV